MGAVMAQKVTRKEADAVLKPAEGPRSDRENPEGLRGRVLTGYQGWFRAPGDGSGMGFSHYGKHGKFAPGSCTIELWPDLSEFDEDEKYDTAYLAMFDEIDEGTALFKVSNDPPVAEGSRFLDNEGLPPDHFLKLSGKGGKLLRGEHVLD